MKPTRESICRVLSQFEATPDGFSRAVVALWESFPDIGINRDSIHVPGHGWVDVLSYEATPEQLAKVYRYAS